MITTAWVFGEEGLLDAHMIRRAVFIEEQSVSEADELDGTDAACLHLMAYENGEPAGTGRILITRDEFIIGRVAVLPAYRNRHLGSLIMRMLIRACCEMGSERQTIHAQVSARPFYEKLGFTAYGGVYEDAGILHIDMYHEGECGTACETCGTPCGAVTG
jgi:ElaA protein